MPITFENDNDVIVYALERVIDYARRTQKIFVAHCVWWLASIIGLEPELIIDIDTLRDQGRVSPQIYSTEGNQQVPDQNQCRQQVHPDRVSQVDKEKSVSTTRRDLTEDQWLDRIVESPERVVQESIRD